MHEEIPSDFVYLLTGYHPAMNFLKEMGIETDETTGVPKHDLNTLESNVRGIFVAGSILAGYDCNKIFIENGREHGKMIARNFSVDRDTSQTPR
jgi:thioredoxin reductase (NADPH)